ncbi:MAG TPA: hypothetical protein P5165_10865 [Spirochaetia bacterium]|nr:hypothetical protein [Spirochaetales bacterium]HRY73716.1 hypothetical protein [Spirochaetia bacterium]
MSQELYPVGSKRCFACIQWEGRRSYDPEKKLIKADAGSAGRCLVIHQDVKGSHYCDNYFPLR